MSLRILDEKGFDPEGFNSKGIHKETGTIYNPEGFTIDGIHEKTGHKYSPDGYDMDGNYIDVEKLKNKSEEYEEFDDDNGYGYDPAALDFFEDDNDDYIDEVSEEKVINIPEFLRKNRDSEKNNLEEKEEVNFEEYTEEELLEMSSKLDSELDELDEHKKELEEELEAEKKARRDSLIEEVREKMDKKKELEESIKKIERHLRK